MKMLHCCECARWWTARNWERCICGALIQSSWNLEKFAVELAQASESAAGKLTREGLIGGEWDWAEVERWIDAMDLPAWKITCGSTER